MEAFPNGLTYVDCAELEAGQSIPMHVHKNHHVSQALKGRFRVICPGYPDVICQEGKRVFIPGGIGHILLALETPTSIQCAFVGEAK